MCAGFSQPDINQHAILYDAPASVTNTVAVSGGGELNTANDNANDPTNITPAQITAMSGAESALTQSLGRLIAVAEAYPDLKANQNFAQLQTELADTENKIQAARRFYNGNVRDLSIGLQSFPGNVIGNAFGFKEEKYFELEENSVEKENVKVSF